MKKLPKITEALFSMVTTGILLVVFAIAIAYATFLENDYGTSTAKILVYNALWFEILLFLLAMNLTGSILYNKLISRNKWPVFLFHFAFLFILAGAAITRMTSFEGTVHIREGESSDLMLSESTHVGIVAVSGNEEVSRIREVRFSPYTANRFKESLTLSGKKVVVEMMKFVPSAVETVVEDQAGSPLVSLLAVDPSGNRFDFLLKPEQSKNIGGVEFGFNIPGDTSLIRITSEGGELTIGSSDSLILTGMEQDRMVVIRPDSLLPLTEKTIFQSGTIGFVLKKYLEKGKPELVYVPAHANNLKDDAIQLRVSSEGASREVIVFGKKGQTGEISRVAIDGIQMDFSYGSAQRILPFSLKLNDFQIERYPGSNSPSSFASEVTLIDSTNNIEKPFRIFMNNILKYKGYRFFQSSFDGDEKGTILSVNYDSAGTKVTYTGYFIMALGMVLTLLSSKSRFRRLSQASRRLSAERKKLFTAVVVLASTLLPVTTLSQGTGGPVSPGHAREFGKLLVQNIEGRIEPVNTLASEILRKVAKKGSYEGLEPVQVMLEIMAEPDAWKNIPLIRANDRELRKILGAREGYVTFQSVFEGAGGEYRLRDYVEKAYEKKPAERNRFDKEVINVDERVNIFYKFINGGYLTIFPVPGDKNHKWSSLQEVDKADNQEFSDFARQQYGNYVIALRDGRLSGNYAGADSLLLLIKENQKTAGAAIYPPVFKTKLEIFYINFNIFGKLAKVYVILGLVLLIVQFAGLLSKRKIRFLTPSMGVWMVSVLFVIHTAGLAIRWYISGHAPWSNGYETLLYISWATCLAGLIFSNRSPMTLAVTTLLSAISLFVAGMSWMSPELTNLVPVLKSYWLVIHVAVITASYGFFAVAALLGFLNLVLMILLPADKENGKIGFTIRELVLVTEMAMMVGLFMLTTGSFLGGVWANESWGRYWGWDPKETWALVTVLVYAFIVHMHKIPGFRGQYAVSLAAVVGFGSVLMTYFGVNYYLSGLHSYAQGEPMPVPAGVYIGIVTVLTIAIAAYFSYSKRRETEKTNL